MNNEIILNPIKLVKGTISIPGSKSISNRVLLLSSISEGKIIINNILECDDVNHMITSLISLGISIKKICNKINCYELIGMGDFFKNKNGLELFVGNAGTVIRPLTSILSLGKNNIKLIGDDSMKNRPIKHLVNALKEGGAKIKYLEKENYPPLQILGNYIGGNINLKGNISSQFLSSLLMMCPLAEKDSFIHIKGELVSKPYVNITLNLMKIFGIEIYHNNYEHFYIKGNRKYLSPKEFYVEGDLSSASYFLAAGAIKKGPVKILGINKNSIQGDIKFIDYLEQMGAQINWGPNFVESYNNNNLLNPIDIDANDIPDSAMTIAMVALFVNNKKTSFIKNIYNWRVKETDRLHAMSYELKKIGAKIIEGKDFIYITPPKEFKEAIINTYNDHRIAMCFSLISLSNVRVIIKNPICVNKTFPNYFTFFKSISL